MVRVRVRLGSELKVRMKFRVRLGSEVKVRMKFRVCVTRLM